MKIIASVRLKDRARSFFVIVIIFSVLGCLKEEKTFSDKVDATLAIDAALKKEFSYFKSQRLSSKQENIELLENSLDNRNIISKKFGTNQILMLFSINEAFKTRKKVSRQNDIFFVIVFNTSTSNLDYSRLVSVKPRNSQSDFNSLKIALLNLLTGEEEVGIDGEFVFMTPTGKWVDQITIEKGRVISSGVIVSKKGDVSSKKKTTLSGNNLISQTSGCIDWYLITTVYLNGAIVSTTTEYVGTSCPNSCYDTELQSVCPDEGGGSSGEFGPNPERHVIDISHEDSDDSNAGNEVRPPPIKYRFDAICIKLNGQVVPEWTEIHPMTADPLHSVYNNPMQTTRILTLYNNIYFWRNYFTYATFHWSCLVYARYITSSGEKNRTWLRAENATR